MLNNTRLTFYGLVHLLIKKGCTFVLDTSNGYIFHGRKDNETVPFVRFPVFPSKNEDVFVPIFKLEEVSRNLGISIDDISKTKIACHAKYRVK